MKSPFKTPLFAVFQNEVLLNSKRVAPYVLMLLFIVNAVMWSVRGAAAARGWATNSDFNIARNFLAFSWFLGLPIFNAVIMGDPVLRDFRLGVDSLIFSKPISRASYLIGKFLGNFFVLVCCMSIYALALILMQVVHTSAMIVLPVRVLPYFKHFFFFPVISNLLLAAIYFSVATLTRSTKLIYGLAVSFYPVYLGTLFAVNGLPTRWRLLLDPMLFSLVDLKFVAGTTKLTPAFIDQYIVNYSPELIINRGLLILGAVVCLTILYLRFAIAERPVNVQELSLLNLSTAAEGGYYDPASLQETRGGQFDALDYSDKETLRIVPLPEVTRVNEGFRVNLNKLIAAIGIEFRLLRAERGLIVIMPLAIFLSTFELAFYEVAPDVSYSAAYSSNTAKALLLFLVGITVFYTGEAMHRDREVKVESVLWATPASNNVLLLSKFLSTSLLALFLVLFVGITAIVIQLVRGHTPVEVSAYLTVYSVILIPSIAFMAGVSMALSVLLRDKYLAYAVSIATGAGLFYLYGQGFNHWLYNPVLYQLWTYADLTGVENNSWRILAHRVYCLAIASLCLALAHLRFRRQSSSGGIRRKGRLNHSGWALLVAGVSLTVAVIMGLMIVLP